MVTLTIKMSGTSASFLFGFDIRFVTAESSFKLDSWTYIIRYTNVDVFTVKLTSYEIRLTSDCTSKGIIKNNEILTNIAIVTTYNTACSSFIFLG